MENNGMGLDVSPCEPRSLSLALLRANPAVPEKGICLINKINKYIIIIIIIIIIKE